MKTLALFASLAIATLIAPALAHAQTATPDVPVLIAPSLPPIVVSASEALSEPKMPIVLPPFAMDSYAPTPLAYQPVTYPTIVGFDATRWLAPPRRGHRTARTIAVSVGAGLAGVTLIALATWAIVEMAHSFSSSSGGYSSGGWAIW